LARDKSRAVTSPLKSLREQLKTQFSEEFETMYQMLTYDKAQFNLPGEHASTVMIETSEKRYSYIVRKLVELGVDPNVRGARKQTPLHIFAYHGDDSMTRFLLSQNVLVDARDKHNRTPLHWAAWAGQADAVLALLSKRADVNAVDYEGRTALYGAAGGGYVEVVRLLLSHNAERSIRGGRGNETPLERARKKHNTQLIDLLSG
jgi:ankyrin repeat protein